jgi:hypothetical protein
VYGIQISCVVANSPGSRVPMLQCRLPRGSCTRQRHFGQSLCVKAGCRTRVPLRIRSEAQAELHSSSNSLDKLANAVSLGAKASKDEW